MHRRQGDSRVAMAEPNTKHWFTTSFFWRKVPESGARSVPPPLTQATSYSQTRPVRSTAKWRGSHWTWLQHCCRNVGRGALAVKVGAAKRTSWEF